MPSRRRAPRKRPRAPGKTLAKVRALAIAMEEPLYGARDYVRALMLIGWGLMGPGPNEDERAIDAVARAAARELEILERQWDGIFKALRR